MKNIAVVSGVLMLLGSAVAKPMQHRHHRRNVEYVYKTETCTKTVYYTSTYWVNPTPPAHKPPTKPADNQAKYTPPASAPENNNLPPPPANNPPSPPPAKPEYKPTPADAAAAANQAAIESVNAVNAAQEQKNKAQESINAAQQQYNQQYQNGQHPGGSGQGPKETPPPKPQTPPPPPPQQAAPPAGGGGGGGKSPLGGQKFNGDGTYYSPSVGTGACGWDNSDDELVCAISKATWDKHMVDGNPNHNSLCGTYVRATNPDNGKSVRVKVVDNCYGCIGETDVDMTPKAFGVLGVGEIQGRIKIDWEACT